MADVLTIIELFNNREKATITWIVIILMVFLTFSPKVRASFFKLVKGTFKPVMLLLFLSIIGFVALEIFVLHKIGFWEASLIPETLFWFIVVGLGQFLEYHDKRREKHYIRGLLLDNLRLTAFLEFLSGFYATKYWIEMLIFPAITGLALMVAVANTDSKLKSIGLTQEA